MYCMLYVHCTWITRTRNASKLTHLIAVKILILDKKYICIPRFVTISDFLRDMETKSACFEYVKYIIIRFAFNAPMDRLV